MLCPLSVTKVVGLLYVQSNHLMLIPVRTMPCILALSLLSENVPLCNELLKEQEQ